MRKKTKQCTERLRIQSSTGIRKKGKLDYSACRATMCWKWSYAKHNLSPTFIHIVAEILFSHIISSCNYLRGKKKITNTTLTDNAIF